MTFFERNKAKIILISVTLVLIILMAFSSLPGGKANPVSNVLGVVISPVQKAVSWVLDGTGGFFDYLVNMKQFESDNADLRAHITALENEVRETEQLEKENTRLRALLELRDRSPQYDLEAAQVVARDPGNWFITFTIDKGTSSGVGAGNPVIVDSGLVGYVYEVGSTWAKVRTIIDPSSAAAATVKRTGDTGVAEGNMSLSEQGLCAMSYLQKDANITAGDAIETAGTGGIYPPGLYIGKVLSVEADADGISRQAVVEPGVDFESLGMVMVIKSVLNAPEVGQ
ncbi:MAG: rod shape-determining protein MreC [Ruminococcaceae bacterium]|nr:rod shape-determining protein MreC [Oscillospiraceae bacterium]